MSTEANPPNPDQLAPVAGAHPGRHTAFDDARMDIIMGRLLQVGVLLAATVVLAGGALFVARHTGDQASYRAFTAHPLLLRHPSAFVSGIAHGDAGAIIDLGILLLIATPMSRVAFAVVAFAMERDRLYVAISVAVLAVLVFGMLRGG